MAYTDEIQTVLELIAEYGKPVTWRQLAVDPEENVSEPWKQTDIDPIEYSVNIVFLPVNRIGFESLRPIQSAPDVVLGNTIGYMGAYSFEPAKKDLIVDGSRTLRIRNITTIAPDGTPILYIIELDL